MLRSFFRSQQLLSCSTHSPVHHRVHCSTPLVHAMSHINQSTLFNPIPLRSILIISSHLTPRVSRLSLSSPFSNQILEYINCACYMSRLSHPQLHHPNSMSVHTTHPAVFSIPLSLLSPQTKASAQFNNHTLSAHPCPPKLHYFCTDWCTEDTFQNTVRISVEKKTN